MPSPLSQQSRSNMKVGSGWIKFVSILLIIGAALFLIYGLMNSMKALSKGAGLTPLMIVLFLGSFIGTMGYLLLLYSNSLSESAEQGDLRPMESGLRKLRTYMIILGILTILGACYQLYLISQNL